MPGTYKYEMTYNPTYDNPAVIAEKMRERGLWEEFMDWHWDCIMFSACGSSAGKIFTVTLADILTTPALLAQAIVSWWETKHVWKGDRYEVR
jgi:hypothetical protein